MQKNSVIDWSLIIAIGIAWGSSFLFIKVSAPEVGPITLVFSRLLIASLILTPFLNKFSFVRFPTKHPDVLDVLLLRGETILLRRVPLELLSFLYPFSAIDLRHKRVSSSRLQPDRSLLEQSFGE